MSVTAHRQRDRTAFITAIATFLGCAAAVFTDVTTVLLADDLGFVADTISNAAAGPHAWIQDSGLCILGLSLFFLAFGLWSSGPHGWRRWLSALAIVVVGGSIIVLALHDEYGDGNPGGWVMHTELVYVIGSALLIPMALQAPGFGQVRSIFEPLSWILFALWLIGGPLLFQVPDEIRGVYERSLVAVMLGWLLMAGNTLWCRAER